MELTDLTGEVMKANVMQAPLTLLKRMVKPGLVLLMGVSMAACASLSSHTKGWKEEVLLHDGKVLVVERHFNLGAYPTLDARERSLLDQTITFTLPETGKTISWKADYRQDLPEPNSLGPLLLDIVAGMPYLATSPAGCIAYNKWHRPNPPYVLFKYANDAWQQIPLKEFPPELVTANLMSMPATSLLEPYYTGAASKVKRQDGNVSAYAKTIMRKPVTGSDAITSCLELVLYKGRWIMPNDPVMKAIIDRESE